MEKIFQNYFDSMPCFLSVQDRGLKIIHANERFITNFGDPEGRYCYQVYKQRPEQAEIFAAEEPVSPRVLRRYFRLRHCRHCR